jgi:hypothetical protein
MRPGGPLNNESLEKEIRTFESHRFEWLRSHEGQFVAIVGTRAIGFFPNFESGFKAGLSAVGLGRSFLVKQVWAQDPVYAVF